MEKRVLVVNKIDAEGNISPYTTFVNNCTGKYNLTTLCMQMHGIGSIWDEVLREKYEKKIFTGKNGKNVYFEFGGCTYSCKS